MSSTPVKPRTLRVTAAALIVLLLVVIFTAQGIAALIWSAGLIFTVAICLLLADTIEDETPSGAI